MSSYLHPDNAKRVQQIQALVCLESEREAVNLIIALAWQDVLAHLVNKVGMAPPLLSAEAISSSNGQSGASSQQGMASSNGNGYYANPYLNGDSNGANGHHQTFSNDHGNGHGSGHPSNSHNDNGYHNSYVNGHGNGREAQLFTTLREVEF